MNAEHLLEAIGLIDDRFIAEAEQNITPRRVWVRWAAAAACAALIFAAAIPLVLGSFRMGSAAADKADQNGSMAAPQETEQEAVSGEMNDEAGTDGMAPALHILVFDNGLYEFAYDDAACARAGETLGEAETDWDGRAVLFALADSTSRATVAVQMQDGAWGYAKYCNTADGSAQSAGELFALYGVAEAQQLICAQRVSWDGQTVLSQTEQADWLLAFYTAYSELDGMGNDDWQRAVFGAQSEEEQQALSREIADSLIAVRLLAANGEIILLHYYPKIGYLYQNGVYFKTTKALDSLLLSLN